MKLSRRFPGRSPATLMALPTLVAVQEKGRRGVSHTGAFGQLDVPLDHVLVKLREGT